MKSRRWGRHVVLLPLIVLGISMIIGSVIGDKAYASWVPGDLAKSYTTAGCTTANGTIDGSNCIFKQNIGTTFGTEGDYELKTAQSACTNVSGSWIQKQSSSTLVSTFYDVTCTLPIVNDDKIAPEAPKIKTASKSTLTGTSEPGATITTKDSTGKVLCTSTVSATNNSDGSNWTCIMSPAVADGSVLTVTATDGSGNVSGPSQATAGINPQDEEAEKACAAKGADYTWDAAKKECLASKDSTSACTDAAAASFGFGWILCPGYTLVTGTVDLLVGWISAGLMQWTLLSGNNADPVKNAWGSFLTIANIAFAIVFMIIIYSTATSTGITNYGIKKIMPRLIIVAIGVNLSFYIAAALADLSNIAGIGIKDLLFNMLQLGDTSLVGSASTAVGNIASSNFQVVGLIVLLVLAWSSVLIGLVIIIAALVFRSIALTLLVIVSPLAFVAALLPNTEKWWKKWRDEYIRLLVIYPAFMLVWAGSRFVSNISANTGAAAWLISALASVAPLAVIIPLFKASGGLMGKLTGLTEKGVGKMGGDYLKKKNKDLNSYLGKQGRAKGADFVKDRKLAEEEAAGKNAHDAVLASHAGEIGTADEQIKQFEQRYQSQKFTDADAERHSALSSLDSRDADQQSEFDRLNAKKDAWNTTSQSQEYKDAMANYNAARSTRKTVMRQAEHAEAEAKGKVRSSVGYRAAFYNDNRKASQSENERRRKTRATSVLGTRLADEYGKSNKDGETSMSGFLRSYTGASAASTSAQKEAMQEALALSQQVGNKETSEQVERETALMDNVLGVNEDGTTYTINNSELMDLMAGRTPEIKGKIGDLDYQLRAETRSQKIAVVQRLMAKGSAGEVKELLEIALDPTKESDAYVREAIISGAIRSGKAPAYLGGPAVPGINDRNISNAYQATIATAKGGIKGDIFGGSVGSNQIEDFATGIEMASRGQVEGASREAQAAAVDQTVRYIAAQLQSNNGANLVNSAEKANQMRRMLVAGGMSPDDANALITRAGGRL